MLAKVVKLSNLGHKATKQRLLQTGGAHANIILTK